MPADLSASFTCSRSEEIILNPASVDTNTTVATYFTQIIGRMQGGGILYDQSFVLPYASGTVQAGVAAAIAAITTAGGPGVTIGAPALTDTSQTVTSSSSVTTYTLADTVLSVQSLAQVGPDSLVVGQRSLCSGLSSLPSTAIPICGPGVSSTFVVVAGSVNVNTNINTAYTLDQATVITENGELFQQYTLTGIQPSSPRTTFSRSTTEEIILNPAVVTLTRSITSYLTQIIGQVQGGGVVYDQSFAGPFGSGSVQAGQTAAVQAITTAGGPGVIIGAPVLTATAQTVTATSSVTTYSLAATTLSAQTTVQIGPDTLLTGARTVCTGISALPSTTAPTCGAATPATFTVVSGSTNFNTNTNTAFTLDQTTMTTQSLELFEQYTITGTVQAIGAAHAAVPSLMGDANARFVQRMLDEAAGPQSWANVFGWSGQGSGDHRSGGGIEGGFFLASDRVQLGFGISHGAAQVDIDDSDARADADLTEFGVSAIWRDQGRYLALSGVAGIGSVDTSDMGSTARYGTRLFSLAAEAGYQAQAGDWLLTPHLGAQWTQVRMDGFTEAGPLALTSDGADTSFGTAWLGIAAQRQMGDVTFAGRARLIAYGDDAGSVPVAFVGSSTGLRIDGASRGHLGGEAGVSLALKLGDTTNAFATYDLRFRDGATTQGGTIGLRMVW